MEQLIGEKPLNNEDHIAHSIPAYDWNLGSDPKTTLIVSKSLGHRSFALVMPDKSMEPLFPLGSILIFDPDLPLTDRCYVLAKLYETNMQVFRQLLIDVDQMYLKPLSPDLSTFKMKAMNKSKDKILAVLAESRYNFSSLKEY